MKILRNFAAKHGGAISAFALTVATVFIDGRCWFIFHQPKIPDELASFRKRHR